MTTEAKLAEAGTELQPVTATVNPAKPAARKSDLIR
jgi:hypothetical protein